MSISTVILAAGQSTRMSSDLPKVLHRLAGRPLIEYSLRLAAALGGEPDVVVVGPGAEAIRQVVGTEVQFAVQVRPLGTANALLSAESLLHGKAELLVVISADMPLLTPETLQRLVEAQRHNPGPISLLTVVQDDSHGFGHILRGDDGEVQAIIEEAHATPRQLAIKEVNVGAYCFSAGWLWPALRRIPVSPRGEYYLTDTIGLAVWENQRVEALALSDPDEAIGINNRLHLAEAESILRRRVNTAWMQAGVTIVDPAVTYIEPDVRIGRDTILHPNTFLRGHTEIGSGCEIGPNTLIQDSRVGQECSVTFSVLEGVALADKVKVGPFARLHGQTTVASQARVGNFAEVRSAYLSEGVEIDHYAYIADAIVGDGARIGAGVVTCNMDGIVHQPTEIGAGAVLGSGTALIAPLKIGEKARTGAGSVVTKDVPAGALVKGVPAQMDLPKRARG
jgi:bifunctional UDP-N-acetylglucosamine pyrophosphorylase/glucosamine-1-phosphate N-acetyltransferase